MEANCSTTVDMTPGGLEYGNAYVPDLLELDNNDVLLAFTDGALFTSGGMV
ncbi:MAG: hypothetical protein IEMM0002_0392 [bacterium]|nr:MAG: hypothetical protein IEMM0002_0392 [bacterium]